MKLAVVTKIPSPYQVELFDAVASAGIDLTAIYVQRRDPERQWSPRALAHDARFLDDPAQRMDAAATARAADLAIFAWYRDRTVARMMASRDRAADPWCFWGERPGFSHPGYAGRGYRRWRLWRLWKNEHVPIWGIGHWAIEGYRREFGGRRPYHDVPYASDLSAFRALPPRSGFPARQVLFSGSLIERKGIAPLCEAFRRVAARRPGVGLRIVGTGPLEAALRRRNADCTAIEFLGFRDWDQLASAYSHADILCAPSHHDGWGLVIPEAMAAGLPVIATTSMGAAIELVVEGESGWLVPPHSVPALEAALERAIDTPVPVLDGMRARCRELSLRCDVASAAAHFASTARRCIEQWDVPRSDAR